MTNRPFSKRMLASKKTVGYRSHSYRWKYHPTPWKLFVDAVTKPRDATLSLFGNKRFVLGIFALTIIMGGIILAQGPLFHSMIQNPDYHGASEHDPIVPLFTFCDQKFDLSQYNSRLSTVPFHGGCGTDELHLNPNSTTSAIAIIKTPITLDQAGGKNLYFIKDMQWNTNPAGPFSDAAFYLTTNSTLPSDKAYNPTNDKSVFFVGMWEATSATSEGVFYFIKDGGDTNTLISESHGCNSGSASSLVCGPTFTPGGNLPGTDGYLQIVLNYTGITTTQTINTISIAGSGGGSSASISDYKLPPTFFQSNTFYLGFWDNVNNPAAIFRDNGIPPSQNICCAGTSGNEELIGLYSPPVSVTVTTPPNLDTGGFFGPIIRALIAIGVFIVQNIINFLAFLANVLFPVLATVFGILANALVAVLNAIGNFFGLGNIGTTISNFFTAVGNFLVNGVGAIFGQIANAGSFVVNGISAFVNIAGSYWTKITSFFSALGALFTIIGTVIGDFTNLSAFSGNIALFMDWTWGMYKTYDEGTEGFHRWLDFNEHVFLKTGTVAYVLADHLFTVILRVKQLIVQWI